MSVVLVTTWYLEMRARPSARRPEAPPGIVLARYDAPTARGYRFLYDTVGDAWHWVDRRKMRDDELLAAIRRPEVEIHVARHEGELVGYFELARDPPGECQIAYFGLAPAWIGRRVGSWLLDRTIQRAWEGETRRVTVHTCSLDHPRALANYERAGFVRYDEAFADFDTDRTGLPPPVRSPS